MEEYTKDNILDFRKRFAKLQENQKKMLERARMLSENRYLFVESLIEPCQVVVVEMIGHHPTCVVVMHNANLPDMATIILENVLPKEISAMLIQEPRLLKWLGKGELESLASDIHRLTSEAIEDESYWTIYAIGFPSQTGLIYIFRGSFRYSIEPYLFSKTMFKQMMDSIRAVTREQQQEKVKEAVENIRKEAEAIPSVNLREKMLRSTEKLEKQIRQIEELDRKQEKLENEMTGVRKLIGSKTFGEWKVLLSEIDKINTRIDALWEVKDAYDKVLTQQAEVMKQQASFVTWIKYATILIPIALLLAPIIDLLLRHFLNVL